MGDYDLVGEVGSSVSQMVKILISRSYYHRPQRVGRAFHPGELAGYFNDLIAKTYCVGYPDEEGIPANILADGRRVYFATTVVQKSLGHWDRWLLTHEKADKVEFLKLCLWLLSRQNEQGSWAVWPELGLSLPSPYSAMIQGECISAFARAYKITKDEAFAKGAGQALTLMCKPIEAMGPAIYGGKDIFPEEVPFNPRLTILNGWIFALFGLYDFWLAFGDKRAYEIFKQSLDTLLTHINEYDAGYWSYYDVQKHLASPFYYTLYIHQITALAMIEIALLLTEVLNRWKTYQRSRTNRLRTLSVKALQKLREPGEVVIIK